MMQYDYLLPPNPVSLPPLCYHADRGNEREIRLVGAVFYKRAVDGNVYLYQPANMSHFVGDILPRSRPVQIRA